MEGTPYTNTYKPLVTDDSKLVTVDSRYPFTAEEEVIMKHLLKAQELFVALPRQNKNAVMDFLKCTHDQRRIMAMRTMQRTFPDYFVEP